jgi:N-acetylglucosaminyldiphosphoundecaprenol N-acetyl-beta-D-mannosaminyltransferase
VLWADVLLALLLALLTLPIFLLFFHWGALERRASLGHHGRTFQRLMWHPKFSIMGRLGKRFGMRRWPTLINIIRGDMAWVGPRPLLLDEPSPPEPWASLRVQVRPGVFTLWRLRQLTSIDYGNEWETEQEQLFQGGRWGLLLRCLLASLYGQQQPAAAVTDSVLVDTVRVNPLTMDEALARIDVAIAGDGFMQIVFVNADCVNIARRDSKYRGVINRAALSLPDGIGLRIASKMLRRPLRQNVNGTDMFPRLCQRLSDTKGSLSLLGAKPGVAVQVAQWVKTHYPAVRVVGARHGFFSAEELPGVLRDIRDTAPDVLLVALGAPLQDRWIAEHGEASGAKVAIGVGGLFDFFSERVSRAPQWLRELGLEWTYRLIQEPQRMWRRYLVGNFSFLLAVSMQRLLGSVDDWDFSEGAAPGVSQPVRPDRHGVLLALNDQSDPIWREAAVQPAMLPLGDRPVVLRAMDTLAAMGCSSVDLLADEGLPELREALGDGSRWGMRLNIHALNDQHQALRRLDTLSLQSFSDSVVARADHWLPAASLASSADEAAWVHADGERVIWTGWALVKSENVRASVKALLAKDGLSQAENLGLSLVGAGQAFDFSEPQRALDAQARWMDQPRSMYDTLPETSPGIRVSPSAQIAPDAKVIAPVEIYAGAVIGSGAEIGPHVHIGSGALIEGGAMVRRAYVAADTYVSTDTEVEECMILPGGVLSARWQQWLPASLTQASAGPLKADTSQVVGVAERGLAAGLLLVLAVPAVLLRVVGHPSRLGRHLLPGLPSVIMGRQPLVGVSSYPEMPVSIEGAGWAGALSEGRTGLVTPAVALGVSLESDETRAWADIHWLLNRNWGERLRLLGAYLKHPFAPAQV